ncbi:PHD finger protein 10 [Trebouxia sp. C0010 RCD-2024]
MGKRKCASSPCSTGGRKRARQLPCTLPTLDAANHSLPDDCVRCIACLRKDGEDFLLCDACDGGMHRQCALLDKVPEGFWACFSCQRQPTVDSAIRQVLHKHSESGLSKEYLLKKVRQWIPDANADPAELSKGLEQALNHANVSFDHDYKVVMRGNRYYLVNTTAADASSDQQLLPDSDDAPHSSGSSDTLGSEDDVPNPHRRISRRASLSSQHPCPASPTAIKGSCQEAPEREHCHHATADSGTASSSGRQVSEPSPQKCGAPDHASDGQGDVLKPAARKSVAVRQESCGRAEQFGSGDSRGNNHSHADPANLQAHMLMAQTKTEQQELPSHATDPLACNLQTCMGSPELRQLQQQQQQPQQPQGSSSDVSEDLAIAHSCVCSALAGLGRFHAYSAAKQVALVAAYTRYVQMQGQGGHSGPGSTSGMGRDVKESSDQVLLVGKEAPGHTEPADQELSAQGVESDAAHPDQELQLQCAASPQTQTRALCAPLPSVEDPTPGVAHFLSIMGHNDVQTMPLQQRRSQVRKAVSQLVELSSHIKGFEHLLDTLDANRVAELVQAVCSRMHTLATCQALEPVMVGVFLHKYWQHLAARLEL